MPEPNEEVFEPDWLEIVESPLWDAQLRPYIEGHLAQRHREMETEADYDTFQAHQGACAALRALLEMPYHALALEQQRVAQQTKAGYKAEEIHRGARGRWNAGLQRLGIGRRNRGAGGTGTGTRG